jgi:hypothetical protein
MHGAIPPLPLRLHGVVQGQLYLYLLPYHCRLLVDSPLWHHSSYLNWTNSYCLLWAGVIQSARWLATDWAPLLHTVVNLYSSGIGDLNPLSWGCRPDFTSGVNGLAVRLCDAQKAGPRVTCVARTIKVDIDVFNLSTLKSRLIGILPQYFQLLQTCVCCFIKSRSKWGWIVACHLHSVVEVTRVPGTAERCQQSCKCVWGIGVVDKGISAATTQVISFSQS